MMSKKSEFSHTELNTCNLRCDAIRSERVSSKVTEMTERVIAKTSNDEAVTGNNSSDKQTEDSANIELAMSCDNIKSEPISSCDSEDENTSAGDTQLPARPTQQRKGGLVVTLKLQKPHSPWSTEEDEDDELPVVFSTAQPKHEDAPDSPPPQNTAYTCQHCHTTFEQFGSWKLHMASAHGETSPDLVPDLLTTFSFGPSSGAVPDGDSNSQQMGQGSGKEERVRPYVCDVCNKAFGWSSHLKRHKLIHITEKPYVCGVCNKGFNAVETLRVHSLVHSDEKPFMCDVCKKFFRKAADIRRHSRVHTGERPYTCQHCDASFNDSSCLRKHMMSKHVNVRQYVCDVCEARFSRADTLTTHKKVHTGEKLYACEVCGAAFASSASLTIHKRIHSVEASFVCDVCKKAFSGADTLKRHKRLHTGEKPHTCEICGLAYTENSHLLRHKRKSHGDTGAKPRNSAGSGKAVAGTADQKTHSVAKERPHTCPHCPAAFAQKQHLKKHVDECHSS